MYCVVSGWTDKTRNISYRHNRIYDEPPQIYASKILYVFPGMPALSKLQPARMARAIHPVPWVHLHQRIRGQDSRHAEVFPQRSLLVDCLHYDLFGCKYIIHEFVPDGSSYKKANKNNRNGKYQAGDIVKSKKEIYYLIFSLRFKTAVNKECWKFMNSREVSKQASKYTL